MTKKDIKSLIFFLKKLISHTFAEKQVLQDIKSVEERNLIFVATWSL